jgi:hypothetical protein
MWHMDLDLELERSRDGYRLVTKLCSCAQWATNDGCRSCAHIHAAAAGMHARSAEQCGTQCAAGLLHTAGFAKAFMKTHIM